MKHYLPAFAVFLAFGAAPAAAGTLLATDSASDELVLIDTETLARTIAGPLGVDLRFNGAAYDAASNTLYATSGREDGNLYRVNVATGAATFIGSSGINQLFGLEFDSSTGTLYATQFGDFGIPMSGFYRLDTATGAATEISPALARDFGSLAYDSTADRLVGMNEGAGDLYAIDRATGALTLLVDGDFVDNGGLAYDQDLNLFWYAEFSGNLYSYDPSNGFARSLVSTGNGNLAGLAYRSNLVTPAVPEPASWAMMIVGFGAVGSAMRTRRRAARVAVQG